MLSLCSGSTSEGNSINPILKTFNLVYLEILWDFIIMMIRFHGRSIGTGHGKYSIGLGVVLVGIVCVLVTVNFTTSISKKRSANKYKIHFPF